MWEVTITNKTKTNGWIKVYVDFKQGEDVFSETYETRHPCCNWLQENIKRRIKELDAVNDEYPLIALGSFNVAKEANVPRPTTAEGEYALKLKEFTSYVEAVKRGIISEENEHFKQCLDWLRSHFQPEYIKLM